MRLVLTGEMMATRNLAWMPTLSYDTQAVLATDKVRFQGQEVACVIADDPYIAKDACEAIVVDYEPLPVIVNPMQAMAEGAPLIRDDKENQHDNVVLRLGGGRPGRPPTAPSRRPTWSRSSSCTTRARTPRRWSAAGRSPTSTGRLEADRLHDHAGAAHHPGRGGAGRRAARAHDPDHLAGPRRRVRQQGAGLPGLRHVDPGLDPHSSGR